MNEWIYGVLSYSAAMHEYFLLSGIEFNFWKNNTGKFLRIEITILRLHRLMQIYQCYSSRN